MATTVWKNATTIYGLAAVVGVVAGIGAVLFEYLSQFVAHLALGSVGYTPEGPRHEPVLVAHDSGQPLWIWGLLLLPALGGLVAGALCRCFAPEASGHGTDAVIDAYHNKDGQIRGRVPVVKALATAISLGTGGSGGREGPIAQMGAGFGSVLGNLLKLSARQRRILLAAGMGAGVGAMFRAPLAGALFAAEILYRDAEFESDVLMPSVISSAVAYCVCCGWFGEFTPLFSLDASTFRFDDPASLGAYTFLAVLLVPVVIFYAKIFYAAERAFHTIPLPRILVAGLGGLLTGAVGVGLYFGLDQDPQALSVMSYGYGILQSALELQILGWDGVRLLVLVALFKIITTSLTISSGGSGGVFGPSMVIGGCLGGAVGVAAKQLGWIESPASFVIVGMSGFFAGAASTPISTIIMVSEMTGGYQLLLPSMWVCGITFLLCSRWTIYTKQVPNRAFSNAHKGEFLVPLLQSLCVKDVLESERQLTTVRFDTPLKEVVRLIAETHDDYFPVLDAEGRFIGIFSAHDLREFTYDASIHHLAIASDLMTSPPITVTPDMDLHSAVGQFSIKNLDELPVVAAEDPQQLLGMLRRRAITRAYSEKLSELKELQRKNS